MRTAVRDMTRRARTLLVGRVGDLSKPRAASEELAKDAALTHLIGSATWKMLEARRLVSGPIDCRLDSDVFAQLGAELPILSSWDRDSRRRPPPTRLRDELIGLLNEPALEPAWAPGNEETLGWIFQYFNEPDLEVFRSPRAPKVPPHLVAAKTQLFTPRWIVEALVQNSLGRFWMQMHPDSDLGDRLDYLVPLASEPPAVPLKPVGEITVLDPACGAMHFGLAAFDLLVEMYKEEQRKAGRSGWPAKPSVEQAVDIPAAILANNLFGIDLDPRAVCLSALTLYLKAKPLTPHSAVTVPNLTCADVLLHGRTATGQGPVGSEGLAVMNRAYDVVVTNPPYMDSRQYNPQLKSLVDRAYPVTRRNLYSVFLERSLEFLGGSGRLGIITPQTFMFISSFARTRALLRERAAIETLVHTGLNTFPDAVVDAAFYVLRREPVSERREQWPGTYFRLVKEPNADTQRVAFVSALRSLRAGGESPAVYHYQQADFDALPGSPWVYWITPALRSLFKTRLRLSEIARPVVGLQTSDNFRFLRYWWEVFACGKDPKDANIAFGCRDGAEARASGRKWFPHMKGGSFRRWYGNQEHVVNWADDGAEIKALGLETGRIASRPQNTGFYFRSGVTWTHTSSRGLSVRILPPGFICNVEAVAAFRKGPAGSDYETLAILNSTFARHVIDLLNPTVHFGTREVGGLPYPAADAESVKALDELVAQAIALARADCQEDETTCDFVAPPAWPTGPADVAERHARLARIERQIDEQVYRLYELGPDDRAVIEADLSMSPAREAARDNQAGPTCLARESLARRWISYAVGIVLGRFHPGVEGALGCGRFPPGLARTLRGLATHNGVAPNKSGVAVLDPDHPDDLAAGVAQALELIWGAADAAAVVHAAVGRCGEPGSLLRSYFKRPFFKQHIQQYRGRPVYWLLQSPKGGYSLYAHYGHLSRDTLVLIRGPRFLAGKLEQTRHRIEDPRTHRAAARGPQKRRLQRPLDDLRALMTDLEGFDGAIQRALEAPGERGKAAGWERETDDGVMLNLAPLHELVSSWKPELTSYWKRLQAGDYDWSGTARRYWPARVLQKCRTNKSHALAHARLDVYQAPV